MESTLYPHVISNYGLSVARHPSPQEFVSSYVPYAVGASRVRRSS
jgi:hypothetical protein